MGEYSRDTGGLGCYSGDTAEPHAAEGWKMQKPVFGMEESLAVQAGGHESLSTEEELRGWSTAHTGRCWDKWLCTALRRKDEGWYHLVLLFVLSAHLIKL